MILDAATKSLEIALGAAVAANQCVVVSSWADITAAAFTPGATDVLTNGATPVTIVAGPSSGQRQVKEIMVLNLDTASVTIKIRYNNNTTIRQVLNVTIAPNETLVYREGMGWMVMSIDGNIRQGGTVIRAAPLQKFAVVDAANITAVTVFATTVCQALYCGPAPFATSSINLLVNVTALVATITWAEIAIYKGSPTLGVACPDLTRLGYLDVAAVYNSTGRKNNAISLTVPAAPGDNIWVVMGSQATTPFQVRGALADEPQSGLFQTLTARPSLTPGPIAGVLGGAAAVPAWGYIRYN